MVISATLAAGTHPHQRCLFRPPQRSRVLRPAQISLGRRESALGVERRIVMAKCQSERTESESWRIKSRTGEKVTIYCLACNCKWDSESKKFYTLPRLTEEEMEKHLVDKYD